MNDYELQNRNRLIHMLDQLPTRRCPEGWRHLGMFAVGGLTEIGFSKRAEMLLIVSRSGRGVIDCELGKKVARDEEEHGDWYMPAALTCEGIGPIQGERIQIAGLHGGGLPTSNHHWESLEIVAPNWPKFDLIFCPPHQCALSERHQAGCAIIASEHICAFGFSWSGKSFAYATESDVSIFSKRVAQP